MLPGMGRRTNKRVARTSYPAVEEDFTRTLADAEADEAYQDVGDFACPCGGTEFLLEAYLHVSNGLAKPEPLEVEALTCPNCGREFDAVMLEDGRFSRGDFRGWTDVDDDDD